MITRIEGVIPVNAPDLGNDIKAVIKIDQIEGTIVVEMTNKKGAEHMAKVLAEGGVFLEFRQDYSRRRA